MIRLERYSSEHFEKWNELISRSKNGTFLLNRNFMDYHSDRFKDFSLMIYRNDKLEAVFPANIAEDTVYSHQGLTYGGMVYTSKVSATDMLEIFEALKSFYQESGVKKLIYKSIPYIYDVYPSQEDLYALFVNKAKQIGCNISSTIDSKNFIGFSELRKRGLKKALKNGLKISETPSFSKFWTVLEHNLMERYGVKPVHSLEEILLLKERFPANIFVHTIESETETLAGVVMFVSDNVAHVQYISATEEGKKLGALDMLFHELITQVYKSYSYFDFGQSTEQNGNYLNEALIFQKEGFGGRGVAYNVYELMI